MNEVKKISDYKRKPDWIRVKAPISKGYNETRNLMRGLKLTTVCEEAACPNIGECWTKKHTTVMILGDTCTRACRFCNIKTGKGNPVDVDEPGNVAEMVVVTNMKHIVITSVDRDDLADGGADQFVKVIAAVREASPDTTIEILTPDFRNKPGALETVIAAKPDVFNHNLETVPRLYTHIRPGARYFHSLNLLSKVKEIDPEIFTKSGIMVGLGETEVEVMQVMDDMRSADIDFMTIGQYLQPTKKHVEVEEFIKPDQFLKFKKRGLTKGFLHISSSPLTRSSHHASEDFEVLKAARLELLKKKGKSLAQDAPIDIDEMKKHNPYYEF